MRLITVKEMAEVLLSPDFDNILVVCHANPDGDAVGSAWALTAALRGIGKKARSYCADRIGQDFSYISSKFTDGDFEVRKIVTCDVASPELLGEVDFADRIDAAIDHHAVNTLDAAVKTVNASSASCGEIVLAVIREMGAKIDEYIAGALYTAISTDTGCFRYSNTNEKTFEAAAYISKFAKEGDFYKITKKLFETKSRKRIALEAYTAQNTEYLFGDRVGFMMFTSEICENLSVQYWDLDPMINVIRQTEGVLMSVVAKEKESDVFKISVRTEAEYDAADFCLQFGGGGHKKAAGCTIKGTAEEVRNILMKKLGELFK